MDITNIQQIKRQFTMQVEFLDCIEELIVYDKAHAEVPEKTYFLQAFCDTQRKALQIAQQLAGKHENALLAEQEKKQKDRAEQERKKRQEIQRQKEQELAEKCLHDAETDETSLFSMSIGDDEDEKNR